MYVKSIVKLLRERPGMSIYAIAKKLGASEGAIGPCIKKLRAMHVVSDSNILTDLGERLYGLIQATKNRERRKEYCVGHFGLDAIKTGKQLRALSEKKNIITVTEIKDPPPNEVLLEEMKSAEIDFAVSMVHFNKRFAGWFRPWQILFSLELSWEEKMEFLGKWYEEYWPEVHTMLGIGISLAPVVGTIIVNEASKNRAPERGNHGMEMGV